MNKIGLNDIYLNEPDHKYILKDEPDFKFFSVTEFIHRFFEPFDRVGIAKNLIKRSPKYRGKKIDEVLEDWSKGAIRGTIVHNAIEDFIKKNKTPIFSEHSYMANVAINWIKNIRSKKPGLEFFSEVIVYDKALGVAGTIDLLVYDKEKNIYHIVDWKTNKKINKQPFGNKRGITEASSHIGDCNFNHYALQLSFYKYILERSYNLEVEKLYLFHIKDSKFWWKRNKDDKGFEMIEDEKNKGIFERNDDLINMLREEELL
tara:strand:+ start:145 stop:924 length:780 start_codon:yes stop_codon:yes gene_type:complete